MRSASSSRIQQLVLSIFFMMEFPATESLTLHVFFDEVVGLRVESEADDADSPPAIVLNDLLAPLGLDSQDCNLNQFVLPMVTPSQRFHCPGLERTSTHWTSWDTKLDQFHAYHLLILNQDVFSNVKAEAEALEFSISFGPPGGDLRCRSILHIHVLDMTELVDLCGRLMLTAPPGASQYALPPSLRHAARLWVSIGNTGSTEPWIGSCARVTAKTTQPRAGGRNLISSSTCSFRSSWSRPFLTRRSGNFDRVYGHFAFSPFHLMWSQ